MTPFQVRAEARRGIQELLVLDSLLVGTRSAWNGTEVTTVLGRYRRRALIARPDWLCSHCVDSEVTNRLDQPSHRGRGRRRRCTDIERINRHEHGCVHVVSVRGWGHTLRALDRDRARSARELWSSGSPAQPRGDRRSPS